MFSRSFLAPVILDAHDYLNYEEKLSLNNFRHSIIFYELKSLPQKEYQLLISFDHP